MIIAALGNIFLIFSQRGWIMAFLFGLALGFAIVLADLGLPPVVLALVGFNLGVEAGHIAIVAIFLPIAFLLRHTWFYLRVVLSGGSIAIVVLAAIWLTQSAFDLKALTF